MKSLVIKYLFALIVLGITAFSSWAQQGNVETFGKNRVQYHDDFNRWNRYESENFITHWYGRGRRIAEAVVQYAEYENESIRSLLEHRTNEKIDIIVYTDITDLHQTNIGDNELFETKPGEVNVLGSKIFVYFNGNQQDLRLQIREGITKVYLSQMLFLDTWQQFFQSIGTEEYPEWYVKGIVAYAKEKWSLEHDNLLRDIFIHDAYKDFYSLTRDYPVLAGNMFWLYMTQFYGESIIANILYLNRINRRIDAAFYYSLNEDLEDFVEYVWEFYKAAYGEDEKSMKMPADEYLLKFKNKYCSAVTKLRYNPQGDKLAFVTNELGKWRLNVHDFQSGKITTLMKGKHRNPFQNPDYDYPMIEWTEAGDQLVIIYEKNDDIHIAVMGMDKKTLMKNTIAPPVERIYDFDIAGRDSLVISANVSGMDDIFIYLLRTRQIRRLSYDYYDDLGASTGYWKGKKGFYFSSNRTDNYTYRRFRDTTLVRENLDIYFMPLSNLEKDSVQAVRITTTSYNHLNPLYKDGRIYFLAERDGKRYLARVNEDGEEENVSSWRSNINTFDVTSDKFTMSLLDGGKENIYVNLPLKAELNKKINRPFFHANIHRPEEGHQEPRPEEEPEEVKQGFLFQSKFEDPENIPAFRNIRIGDRKNFPRQDSYINSLKSDTPKVVEFQSPRVVASRLFFKTDGLDFDMDNNPLFSGLNSYAGEKVGYDFPPFGLLIKSRVYDKFEDYLLEGGARFPVSLDGSEFYLVFHDKKKRWDKIYGVYRKSEKHILGPEQGAIRNTQERVETYIGTYEMRYPFNTFQSLRLRATLRQDNESTYIIDERSLDVPGKSAQRLGLRAEYVYDNTYDLAFNMKSGTRAKVYVEALNRFRIRFSPWDFSLQDGFMTVIGIDARKYFRIDRHAIFAIRGVGSTSFGSEQILFLMGGVDNWLFPSYNDLAQPGEGNFAYRGLAANMRGFKQNIRNGSSYLLANAEFRIAPINYFSRKDIRSAFLRTFQLAAFLDVGTAWYGLTPYSDKNPLNQIYVQNATSQIQARYYRDPIIAGFGGGVRFMLLGMYLKFDYAWGYDTKRINDPSFYFSLGKDF